MCRYVRFRVGAFGSRQRFGAGIAPVGCGWCDCDSVLAGSVLFRRQVGDVEYRVELGDLADLIQRRLGFETKVEACLRDACVLAAPPETFCQVGSDDRRSVGDGKFLEPDLVRPNSPDHRSTTRRPHVADPLGLSGQCYQVVLTPDTSPDKRGPTPLARPPTVHFQGDRVAGGKPYRGQQDTQPGEAPIPASRRSVGGAGCVVLRIQTKPSAMLNGPFSRCQVLGASGRVERPPPPGSLHAGTVPTPSGGSWRPYISVPLASGKPTPHPSSSRRDGANASRT